MDNLKQAINLLSDVVSTMDTISVTGIDNQDKFVGCAQAVKAVATQISDYIASVEACAEKAEKKEDVSYGRKDD